jgi:hypothetical protein
MGITSKIIQSKARFLVQLIGVAQTLASAPLPSSEPAYHPDRILIQPKPGISLNALADFHAGQKIEVLQIFEGIGRLQVLRVPEGEKVPGLIAKYQQSGLVEFAEPDYTGHVFATPNDPKYLDGTL